MAEDNNNETSTATTARKRGRPAKASTGGRKVATADNRWQAEVTRLKAENKTLRQQLASGAGSSMEQGLILRATTEGFTAGVETASRIFEGANN